MTVCDEEGVLMIRMSPAEALATIQSITSQLLAGSPNVGRYEKFLDKDGRDFSIAVEGASRELGKGVSSYTLL